MDGFSQHLRVTRRRGAPSRAERRRREHRWGCRSGRTRKCCNVFLPLLFLATCGFAAEPAKNVKISGHYRLAAGVDSQDFILNDSNADLQERNFRYISGERLNNTYDPAIYDQFLLNVDFSPKSKFSVTTQLVMDPWSLTGTTGEQVQRSDTSAAETLRYNLKYFGAFNSTLNKSFRANNGDALTFPLVKVHKGRTTQTVVRGFYDFSPSTNGVPFTIPELDIDYELRPIRKLWADYTEDNWHARVFAFADETQALSTDDPLELSNHKDTWQQSPWLYQYMPIQFFSDGSIKRGYYSDSLSFLARDSEGHRLVLLRGASLEADLGSAYFAGTVAAPFTPWDEDYFSPDNFPGAFRLKHKATDRLVVGATYTFRTGLVHRSVADLAQAGGVDLKYKLTDTVRLKAEAAASHRDQDLLTNERIQTDKQGSAYKAALESGFDHRLDGHTDFELSFTQMDAGFDPVLSRYTNTRDDHFWGKHITFGAISPELERFRIGDGVDTGRLVVRARWKEKVFKQRFENLFDARNVHKTSNLAYKETVLRNESTWRLNSGWTFKTLFRWQGFPHTTAGVEPFISNFYVADVIDPAYQNGSIPEGRDASRFTYAAAAQAVLNKQWTIEGFCERTNDLPDFPRGLLNSTFRDANDRVDGLLIDRITNFLYSQDPFGAVPPYEYFTVFRERVLFKPQDRFTVTFHAAQNGYKFAAGIDDHINHQGVSVEFDSGKKWKGFADFTHSNQIDVPKLIATNLTESDFRDHYNFYASVDWDLGKSRILRAEYGVFGMGTNTPQVTPYSTTSFSLPTVDTEHLLRVSLSGDF